MNSCSTSWAVKGRDLAIKCPNLVNLTRITIIVTLPSNLGSPSKKSIEISFQTGMSKKTEKSIKPRKPKKKPKKPIKPIKILKKPNQTETEKNQAKPKKPSQTGKNRAKPVWTGFIPKKPNRNQLDWPGFGFLGKNRFKPVWLGFGSVFPVCLVSVRFGFVFF